MPFGGGLKKLATNSSLNSSKNIIDPSPHRQKVGSATLPQGEGYGSKKILSTRQFIVSSTLPKIIFLGGGLLDREGASAYKIHSATRGLTPCLLFGDGTKNNNNEEEGGF